MVRCEVLDMNMALLDNCSPLSAAAALQPLALPSPAQAVAASSAVRRGLVRHLSAEDTTYAGRDKGEFNAWADKNNPNLRKLEKKRAGMKGFEVKKHLE